MRVWAGGLGVLLLSFLTPGCGASRVLTAFQYHAQPIPSGKEARTQAEVRQAVWRYGQRTLSQAYQRLGKHDARWDKAAVKYAERSALFFAQMPGAPDQRELLAQGKALIGLGCDDPLMLYLYGAALQVNDKGAESEPGFQRSPPFGEILPPSRRREERGFRAHPRPGGKVGDRVRGGRQL